MGASDYRHGMEHQQLARLKILIIASQAPNCDYRPAIKVVKVIVVVSWLIDTGIDIEADL